MLPIQTGEGHDHLTAGEEVYVDCCSHWCCDNCDDDWRGRGRGDSCHRMGLSGGDLVSLSHFKTQANAAKVLTGATAVASTVAF